MTTITASAAAFFNGDFYCITTQSVGMLVYPEPDVPPIFLSPDADDLTLGQQLRRALQASKRVSPEEFQKIWRSGGISKLEDSRQEWTMQHYGYKSRRAMLKSMDTCSVSVTDGEIEIQPTHQKSLDGYTVTKDEGPFPLSVPEGASDVSLGAALREGFKRCTSAIR